LERRGWSRNGGEKGGGKEGVEGATGKERTRLSMSFTVESKLPL